MRHFLKKFMLWVPFAYLLIRSVAAVQKIAWGTGTWYGEYSLKWGLLFFSYTVFISIMIILSIYIIWISKMPINFFEKMIVVRDRLGVVRSLFGFFIFLLPVLFFQYTPWGLVFNDIHIRLLVWIFVICILSFLFTAGKKIVSWNTLLVIVLLTSTEFVVAISFKDVTNYPFSLGWSEGNRMWDYSILFGKDLYDYPANQEIFVLLDSGRQFVGGLPFILPGITIEIERFWLASVVVIPYLLLGLSVFRFVRPNLKIWLFGSAWVLIFLKQGPIHPPLILSAAVVALLWKRPLWIAIPLLAVTGYLTEESRFTWIFSVGLWIALLEMAGSTLVNGRLSRVTWIRTIVLSLAGLLGAQFGQKIIGFISNGTDVVAPATSVNTVVSMVAAPPEPLLWYRLLPNATYGMGIVVGLIVAVLPLIVLLLYILTTGKWRPNVWQGLAMVGPLTAFLGVGLIVSTKIGGGGDLHNMDMFLITLVFVTVVAWKRGGSELVLNLDLAPLWTKVVLLLLLVLPGIQSLADMRGYDFAPDLPWLVTLTDSPQKSALDMYPSREVSDSALEILQEQVDLVTSKGGEVLFMDQRQLLTFNFITNVPLVPEYEKKLLMTNALHSSETYFQGFYKDLEAHRFQLIVSEPLRSPIKDSSSEFGEENNAWVEWVSKPILCYYESKIQLKEVGVELFVPKEGLIDCALSLPK